MISVRLKAFENLDERLEVLPGEKLGEAVERVLAEIPLNGRRIAEVFFVVVNGYQVPAEQWAVFPLKESDEVLVCPWIHGGEDGGNLFKQFAILTATVVAAYFTAGLSTYIQVAIVGATTIGSTLLLNALIPPPNPDTGAIGAGYSYSDSQMYAITSQSNTARKLETVPKTYGTHRVFPTVAANPYTELEASAQGNFDQYFYGLYDVGLGVYEVSDIRIGDTPIANFADVFYQLVDFNKPTVDEGSWDTALQPTLKYFKGSASSDSAAVSLNENQSNVNAAASDYQVTRNAGTNTQGAEQDIILSFVNPRGLYAFSTNGARSSRTIELFIEAAKVGTEDWFGFNDYAFVSDQAATGGTSMFAESANVQALVNHPTADQYYGLTSYSPAKPYTDYFRTANMDNNGRKFIPYATPDTRCYRWFNYGLVKGATKMLIANTSAIKVGQAVIVDNPQYVNSQPNLFKQFAGRVAALDPHPTDTNATVVTFETPVPQNIHLGVNAVLLPTWDNDDARLDRILIRYASANWVVPEVQNKDSLIAVSSTIPTISVLKVGTTVSGRASITANTQEPYYSTFRFTPRETGSYKVRVTRVRTYSDPNYTYTLTDDLTFSNITTRFDSDPVQTDKRHVFLELKIRATNQLNGSVSNLSCVASSVLDVYNQDLGQWNKQVTSNPAWVFADLLTGEVNKRAIPKARLHLPSLLDWADFCDTVPNPPPSQNFFRPRFTTNFVLDFGTTLQGILGQVANAAQASLNIVDGKYGVLVDRKRTTPVQVFTPRNSRDFSSTRSYVRKPDGINVSYIDPDAGWEVRQIPVYDTGFDVSNASDFDELTSFAVTNHEQAWRYGRYMLAQNRLRQETISVSVDFEYLVCTRGDYVQLVQDVMKVGGTAARVKSVSGAQVVIDEGLEIDSSVTYGYVYRSNSDGQIRTGSVTNAVLSDTFNLNGNIPERGDLIVIGEVGQVVYDCLVKAIAPGDDLTATLTLVEKADAVYDSESTDVLPDYEPKLNRTVDPDFTPPPAVTNFISTVNTYRCNGTAYQYYIGLDWDVPDNSAAEFYEVFADSGKGYDSVGTTRSSEYEYIVDAGRLGVKHSFKILAVSATGKKIDLGSAPVVNVTPLLKTPRPPDVEDLSIDITNEVLQLVWPKLDACDIASYLIRYSPDVKATWEFSTPLLRVDKNTNLASTQARTGTYLIKAIDFNGNESTSARLAITTIPNLFNLNQIETVNDAPTFDGTFDRAEKVGQTVVLQDTFNSASGTNEYYPVGYYYFKGLLDLSEIYTVRLQSLVSAMGITADDIMANWNPLSSVTSLSNAGSSDWDVETQYRSTEQFNVMSEWLSLSDINPISQGNQDAFTPWRKFIIGDATGRIFQFRLKLISNKASVTPRVFDATILADMPDRLESYDNLMAPVGGYEIVYAPKFKGPIPSPNVQVTIDNAQSGDYATYDYKTLEGLKIRFFDRNNNPVARQFDLSVKGYGRRNVSVI